MPTTYAHYRLGQEVRGKVNEKAADAIAAYPQLFDIGLHGPDILFYYNALSKNKVNTLGDRLHELPGSYFFEHAAKVLKEHPDESAYYAYAFGFICHFSLDVCCHGYIQEKIDESGISHAEIEAEMDREFMVKDGLDPISHKVTGHLHPSEENAKVICEFFPNISAEEVYKTLKDMVMYLDILVAPSRLKRGVLFKLLKMAGHYDSMHGLIINYEKNMQCADSTRKLVTLYGNAVALATELINDYASYVDGEKPLSEKYQYNFSSKLIEREGIEGEV